LRSILLERSRHFFEILKYDKSQWFDFWKEYRSKKFPVVVPLYERKHGLTDREIEEILKAFERPFLDRLYQRVETKFKTLKERAVKEISKRSDKLELSKEKFHMMIIGLLGLEAYTLVETQTRGIVVLLDPVGIEKKMGLDNFVEVSVEAAFKARELTKEFK